MCAGARARDIFRVHVLCMRACEVLCANVRHSVLTTWHADVDVLSLIPLGDIHEQARCVPTFRDNQWIILSPEDGTVCTLPPRASADQEVSIIDCSLHMGSFIGPLSEQDMTRRGKLVLRQPGPTAQAAELNAALRAFNAKAPSEAKIAERRLVEKNVRGVVEQRIQHGDAVYIRDKDVGGSLLRRDIHLLQRYEDFNSPAFFCPPTNDMWWIPMKAVAVNGLTVPKVQTCVKSRHTRTHTHHKLELCTRARTRAHTNHFFGSFP